jgi:predicted DNA binding CopG/RHH family protein
VRKISPLTEAISSVFMVQVTGEKGGKSMKNKIKYTNEPMGELRIIEDFLPPPDQLIPKEENVKITISLKKSSVEFFRKEAQKHRTSYQRMIRRVIDWYASQYQKSA